MYGVFIPGMASFIPLRRFFLPDFYKQTLMKLFFPQFCCFASFSACFASSVLLLSSHFLSKSSTIFSMLHSLYCFFLQRKFSMASFTWIWAGASWKSSKVPTSATFFFKNWACGFHITNSLIYRYPHFIHSRFLHLLHEHLILKNYFLQFVEFFDEFFKTIYFARRNTRIFHFWSTVKGNWLHLRIRREICHRTKNLIET